MPTSSLVHVTVADLEMEAEGLDPRRAAVIYREHGCLVVRGLYRRHLPGLSADIARAAATAIALLPQAKTVAEGWTTPDGTLFLPAPAGWTRDRQIMVLACGYRVSAAAFASALEPVALDIAEAVLGADVELFMDGQVLYKEPCGGHPKHLRQDAAYFQHRHQGPLAVLGYGVDTDLVNGALHVVPGSHRLGLLRHGDTFSHLGLDQEEWPWERSLAITGRAGEAIFFNVLTIHGSQENHSAAPRPVVIHRYRAADDYVIVSATTASAREQSERHAAQARKRDQCGLMVRGFRRHGEESGA